MTNKKYCVYITFYSGNKLPPFYIGYSTTVNVIFYSYHGSPTSREYKHIWKSEIAKNPHHFKTKILRTFDNISDAKRHETYLQKAHSAHKNPMYINKCIQGEKYHSTSEMTPEQRRQRSEALKGKSYLEIYGSEDEAKVQADKRGKSNTGKKRSKETVARISQMKQGFKHSDETKKRLSEANQYRGVGFFTGRNHTEDSKKKIGDASRGRVVSDTTREKLRQNSMGKKHSADTRKKISQVQKGKRKGSENHFFGKAHSDETKEVMSKKKQGRKAITDGHSTQYITADAPIPDGWYLGRHWSVR